MGEEEGSKRSLKVRQETIDGIDWIVYTDVEVAKNNKIIEKKKMSKGECLRSQEVAAGDRNGR